MNVQDHSLTEMTIMKNAGNIRFDKKKKKIPRNNALQNREWGTGEIGKEGGRGAKEVTWSNQ